MNELTISLTPDEQGMVAQINFDALSLRGPDDVQRNGAAVAALCDPVILIDCMNPTIADCDVLLAVFAAVKFSAIGMEFAAVIEDHAGLFSNT